MKISFFSLPLALLLAGACGGASGTDAPADLGTDAATADAAGTDAASTSDQSAPIVYPSDIDATQATALKVLLYGAVAQPLVCEFTATSAGMKPIDQKGVHFTLELAPADVGGPYADARRDDTVLFRAHDPITNPDDASSPIDGTNSMLVSYIPTVEPSLAVQGSVYDYAFHGALTDNLVVTKGESASTITAISFIKRYADGTPAQTIACTP